MLHLLQDEPHKDSYGSPHPAHDSPYFKPGPHQQDAYSPPPQELYKPHDNGGVYKGTIHKWRNALRVTQIVTNSTDRLRECVTRGECPKPWRQGVTSFMDGRKGLPSHEDDAEGDGYTDFFDLGSNSVHFLWLELWAGTFIQQVGSIKECKSLRAIAAQIWESVRLVLLRSGNGSSALQNQGHPAVWLAAIG